MNRQATVVCGMLLALTLPASSASAGAGVNLRWSACFADGGTWNRTFACDTNSGTNVLIGSFELAADLTEVSGVEFVLDVASDGATLPAWWQLRNPGTCRMASLSVNTTIATSAAACVDWASGGAASGLAAYAIGFAGPNTSRIIGGSAVPASALADLVAGQAYFAFNLLINNAKTIGADSCVGCEVPTEIVCNSILVRTPPVFAQPSRDVKLVGPSNGVDSHLARWQGGRAIVPTRRTSWGELKTLFR